MRSRTRGRQRRDDGRTPRGARWARPRARRGGRDEARAAMTTTKKSRATSRATMGAKRPNDARKRRTKTCVFAREHAQSSFPAQIDVMILNRRRAREGGATTDRAMRRGLTKITRRSVRVAGHRVARVAGILQFLCIQFEPDRDVARAVERREHDALRLVRGRAIAGSSVL